MATLQVETGFFPLAFILHSVVPSVEIDGVVHKRPWGWSSFDLDPGPHTVEVSFPYMGPKTGKAAITVTFTSPDEVQAYKYTAPLLVTMGGTLEPHPARAPASLVATRGDALPAVASPADAPYGLHPRTGQPLSDKKRVVAAMLQLFLGWLGAGRFYTGHGGLALIQIAAVWLTCGAGIVWPLIDCMLMMTGEPTDAQGRPLQ